MGKAWLPIIVAAIGSVLVDGSSFFRSLAVNEGSHGISLHLDAFSLVFSSDYTGGACRVDEEQLRRVTGNHIHAFFEGQDNFLNLTLTPRLLIELSFACQDETEIRFDASVTYSVISRGTPSQIRRDLLSYLHQTRNSFAAFLRELGWEDLDRVSVKSYDDIENVVGIPNAQKSSENGVDQSLFLLIAIAAPCFVLIAIVLIAMVCRQRGCCGGNVQRQQQQQQERCEKKTREQLEAEIYGAAVPKQKNGNNKSTRVSSSVETLSGTSDEENSVPLNQEQKSRGNNLIESTVTVETNDMSSVSLSRILASDYPRSGSSSLASEGGTDDDHDNDQTNRGRSSTKNSVGKKKRETALSPKSECRGTIKAPTIYRHLETKTSTTPKRKNSIRKDARQTKTPPKSAFELFVESTKEYKENEMETRSHASSYVPKFMMSFGSALSVASGDETSVCSKSVASSRNKNVCVSGGEKTESVANEQLKMVSMAKADASARYRGTSQSPRRNVSNSPETKPDGHSSVDPVFSASQGKQLAVPPCRRDNGEIASVIDSVDENATDYSPPERTYFFGA